MGSCCQSPISGGNFYTTGDRISYKKCNKIVKIQAIFRGFNQRKKFANHESHFPSKEFIISKKLIHQKFKNVNDFIKNLEPFIYDKNNPKENFLDIDNYGF